MATVYLAQDLKHHRPVALKVMKPEVAAAIGRDRFLREIEIAARLTHPHILPLHDSGESDGRLYYVTPYVPGESLRARLDREGRLPLDDAIRLTREIASALAYAHHRGVVHRDVKPDNVLLSDGIALVADFGVARATAAWVGEGDTATATRGGAIVGTPRYMSPEQAVGGEADARSDLYSLACVLYEMLAGKPPFAGPTPDAWIRKHLSDEPRTLSDLCPSVPRGLSAVVGRGLAKDPAHRFASAARLVEALAIAASGGPARGSAETEAGTGALTPNNLPAQRTSFVGRERELAECARLLGETRLLTLTGIGGCGKTRLAIRLAESRLASRPDGVWFVDLAPLSEAGHVYETVAAVLGVREEGGASLLDSIARQVSGKRLLLVLDNCEHLVSVAAELCDALLRAAGEIRILATSREGLAVEGERLFALRSLGMPSAEGAADPRAVEGSEAVRLFLDRARTVLHEFTLDRGNAGAVAEICRGLDGIPLAIELAAARLRILSVDQIRSRLDDRFRLLAGGSRTALPRHQTLRATIQWSYDLLTAEEQQLFRRLSVFAGGWTLDLCTTVLGGEAGEFEIVDALGRLVEKSLVVVERDTGSEPRYRLLDTVRQYGQERLVESGEAEVARGRHLAGCLALAERAYAERVVREEAWAPAIEAEHDNLRAALAWARNSEPERYLRLAGALAWFWQARSYFHEGRGHLTSALAASPSRETRPARARALWGAASVRAWQGGAAEALPMMEEALRLWRELGDLRETALALEGIGWNCYLGGRDEEARRACEESLRLQQEIGDPSLVNHARVALGQMLVCLGDVEGARAQARAILAYAVPRGDRRSEHYAYHYLADCALYEERYEESLALYRKSLDLAGAIGDRLEITFEIQGAAMSLSGLGDAARALRLAGAVEAEWERLGADVHVRFWDRFLERYLGLARSALGPDAADQAWGEGRRLSLADAVSALSQSQ